MDSQGACGVVFINLTERDPTSVTADVAIVGTGATGLTMALRLLEQGATVAMFETGSFERSDRAEAQNNAKVLGTLPVWIKSRSRFLGGSTNCWGGNNSPLDAVDFERDWVPHARWPVSQAELDPYAPEIHDLFCLGPVDFSVEFWKERLERVSDTVLFEGSDTVGTKIIQKTEVGHLGQSLERKIEAFDGLTVYLNSQITNIRTSADGSRVIGLEARSIDRSHSIDVLADSYVLAAGPENPRLLLASQGSSPAGVGNTTDQVGRYWIAHHSALRGWMEPSADLDWSLYHMVPRPLGEQRIFASLQISEVVQRRERLLNSAANFEAFRPHSGFNSRFGAIATVKGVLGRQTIPLEPPEMTPQMIAEVAGDTARVFGRFSGEGIRRLRGRDSRAMIRNWAEQFPHPDNRVELSAEDDDFGVPRMQITSNLQPEDRINLQKSFETFAAEFERFGYGRWVSDFPSGTEWPAGAINTSHFMGGTRMSVRPEDGVVDPYGQMHEVDNLFIVGGSVFPTSGVSMVTYTAALLALRTADRIAQRSVPIDLRRHPETTKPAQTDTATSP